MAKFAAGPLKLHPLLGIFDQDVAEHGIVQVGKFVPDFARDSKTFQVGTGQPVLKPRNAVQDIGEAANNAADRQEQGGNQKPKPNAKRRFHNNHASALRRRWTMLRQALG